MARFVREIMNPELFALNPDVGTEDALRAILELGITAAPVLDEDRRPVGVTSLRDLLRHDESPRISMPALCVSANETVENAARILGESGKHHLVVVAGDGRAIGMVSSLDLLRAVLGMPTAFPGTFPHYDAELGVSWTSLLPFDDAHVGAAPDAGGVLVLSLGGFRRTETDLWVESSPALRTRLVEILAAPQSDLPALARVLERRDLRFRCAVTADPELRDGVARTLRARIAAAPLPRDAVALGMSSTLPTGT